MSLDVMLCLRSDFAPRKGRNGNEHGQCDNKARIFVHRQATGQTAYLADLSNSRQPILREWRFSL